MTKFLLRKCHVSKKFRWCTLHLNAFLQSGRHRTTNFAAQVQFNNSNFVTNHVLQCSDGAGLLGINQVLQHAPQKEIGKRQVRWPRRPLDGPIEWPPRSPDLTPPDFFLWGVLKDLVYSEKPRTIAALKDVICNKIAMIELDLCRKVCRSVPSRLQKCIEVQGAPTELFWDMRLSE